MAVLKAIVSLYRAGEKKPIERRSKKILSSFLGSTIGLGSFDLKFYRLTKINGKAEHYAISTQQQQELELPVLLGSDGESEQVVKKSVI